MNNQKLFIYFAEKRTCRFDHLNAIYKVSLPTYRYRKYLHRYCTYVSYNMLHRCIYVHTYTLNYHYCCFQRPNGQKNLFFDRSIFKQISLIIKYVILFGILPDLDTKKEIKIMIANEKKCLFSLAASMYANNCTNLDMHDFIRTVTVEAKAAVVGVNIYLLQCMFDVRKTCIHNR